MRTKLFRALSLLIFAVAGSASAGERLPVVFAPGLGVSAKEYREYSPIRKIFKKHGYALLLSATPKYGSIEERARVFIEQVHQLVPSGRFHIVAHSMGGLDARLAIFLDHDIASRAVSLTTLSTPHHGTSAASYLIEYLKKHPSSLVPDHLDESLQDLTIESLLKFNARVTDEPDIRYFSMGFYIPSPALLYTWNPLTLFGRGVIRDAGEGKNDGFVSVTSAQWGQSLGTMPADHFSEMLAIPFGGIVRVDAILKRVIQNLDRNF